MWRCRAGAEVQVQSRCGDAEVQVAVVHSAQVCRGIAAQVQVLVQMCRFAEVQVHIHRC